MKHVFDGADVILQRSVADYAVRRQLHDFVLHNPCDALPPSLSASRNWTPNLFVYWAQGFDDAPPIVKACLRRVRSVVRESRLIELTDANLADYSDLPGYVHDKLASDKTHYADVLRCELLKRHGGVWIDATCYLSFDPGTISPQLLGHNDFAAYRRNPPDVFMLSSWFMISRSNSAIASALLHYLLEYWRCHDTKIHYFLIHFLFEALYNLREEIRDDWNCGPNLDAYAAHRLQEHLLEPFDQVAFRQIMASSMVHKLTYKHATPLSGGTYYAHLIGSQ